MITRRPSRQMSVEFLYTQFKKNNTTVNNDGTVRTLAAFNSRYNGMTIEEAFYNVYLPEVDAILGLKARKDRLENTLRTMVAEGKATVDNSNISESRYYHFAGHTFRFSAHVYPTGSMTMGSKLDMTDGEDTVAKAEAIVYNK